MDKLFIPIICGLIFYKIIDPLNLINLNIALAAIAIIYIFRIIVFEKSRLSRLALGPIGCMLVLLVVSEFLAYIQSSYKSNSFYSLEEIVFLFVLFYLIKSNLDGNSLWNRLYNWMTAIGFLWASVGMFRFLRGWHTLNALGIQDLTSFKQHFSYGMWTTISILLLPYPLILLFKLKGWSWRMLVPLISLLFLFGVLLFSFSRGTYVAILFFVFIVGTALAIFKIFPLRKLLLACCALFAFLFVLALPAIRSLYTTAALFETVSQSRSFESRKLLWKQAIQIAHSSPVFGIGPYNFALHYMAGDPRGGKKQFVSSPMNCLMAVWIEKGMVGLVAYLGVLVAAFSVSLRKLAKKPPDDCGRLIIISLAASLASAVIHQLSYHPPLGNQGITTLTWLLYACLESYET
jgi:hypothetical protein